MASDSGTSGSWRTRPTTLSLSTLFYLTLVFSTSILAQDVSLRPSAASASFPACGLTCALLTQADDACTPPTAPVTNSQTYVSCFCQSSLLANFKNTAEGTCDNTCTTSNDRSLLQQWYVNFCNSGGSTSNSNTNTGSDNNNNNNGDNNPNASATPSSSASNRNNPAPRSWLSGHYQWVIMVVVLVVGFAAITILGVWFKRRHDAKHPNLYHAAAAGQNDSKTFANRNYDSPTPGPVLAAVAAGHESANTVSIASSSRTAVIPPQTRQERPPSRLRKTPQLGDDAEARETPR